MLMNRAITFVTLGLLAAIAATSLAVAAPVTLYVAPNGNDAWSGSLLTPNAGRTDGPLASIAGARDAIRRLRAAQPAAAPLAPVNVVLRGGVHRMPDTLTLRPEDSGTKDAPVTYAAYQNERPILSGGRSITGWKPGPGKLWHAAVPDAALGAWYFQQLWVNGQRRTRARTPNEGYLHMISKAPPIVDPVTGAKTDRDKRAFIYAPGDIKLWPALNDVACVIYHSWETSRLRIASVDEKQRLVTFTGDACWPFEYWDRHQRYYVENAPGALDAPGEWYLDRQAGELRYYPMPGEDMTRADVVAPRLTRLVQLIGEPRLGQYVEHVVFRGLTFSYEDYLLEPTGHSDAQAVVTAPAALMADGARNCLMDNCEISHVGDYGLWLRRGCKDNRIVHTRLRDLGVGGVRIGEATMAATDADESTGNVVDNCHIYDGGYIYDGGVGIWIAQSSHNTISHNEIHDFNYSGMSVGWNWDNAPNRTHDNIIEYNHVHHCMRGVLCDGGAIYTLGVSTGSVIRNNVFHDIFPYLAGGNPVGWGIYLDATTGGYTVENNVVYNVCSGGFIWCVVGGHENVFQNNILAFPAYYCVWPYWEKRPNTFAHNIIYANQGKLFVSYSEASLEDRRKGHEALGEWDYNVYCNTADPGRAFKFFNHSLAEWQTLGLDQHSIFADPEFVGRNLTPATVTAADLALKPTSPALKLGFKPIDISTVGLYGDAAWVNEPKQFKYAPTVLPGPPPPPKPTPVDDGFENTPVGDPLADAVVSGEEKGASIRVSDEQATAGKHSLKVTDVTGLEYAWQPHFFYQPHFTKGTLRETFDLWLGKNALVFTEWRDQKVYPGNVGPSVTFDAPTGNVTAGGKVVTQVPVGQWVHVEIEGVLAQGAPRTYKLTIVAPDQPPQVFKDLAYSGPDFSELHWLGFVSNATVDSFFYLDNIVIKPVADP
jgi:hypothetical protein